MAKNENKKNLLAKDDAWSLSNHQESSFAIRFNSGIISKKRSKKVKYSLDQEYDAWLNKLVVKRKIIRMIYSGDWTVPYEIICGTWWFWVSIWRYSLVLGQYKLVVLVIRWFRVSKGLLCLHILEKIEIWSGDTDAWHTDNRIFGYSACLQQKV